jgi:hypothetical protein
MKVYIVCWGNASQDDNGNCSANCNVHGVYTFLDDAKKGLVECKDEMYNEIVHNPDFDEDDIQSAKDSTEVYGSVEDDYFEIDYESWDIKNEIRIELVVKEIAN